MEKAQGPRSAAEYDMAPLPGAILSNVLRPCDHTAPKRTCSRCLSDLCRERDRLFQRPARPRVSALPPVDSDPNVEIAQSRRVVTTTGAGNAHVVPPIVMVLRRNLDAKIG